MIASAPERTVAPYGVFARYYDAVTGDALFPLIWAAFRRACARHNVRFRRAADLGCGTGAFLACLARPGRELFGVDRSPEMLRQARSRLEGLGVTLLKQDLAELQLPKPVDLVTCNGATLNYTLSCSRLGAIFQRMHANTTFGGHLIFDMILCHGRPTGNQHVVQTISLPGLRARWSVRLDASGQGSVVEMRTRLRRADGAPDVVREWHRQRWFRREEVLQLLNTCRWSLAGTQQLNGRVPDAAAGNWLQFVARRA